jgi:hypothetical protein
MHSNNTHARTAMSCACSSRASCSSRDVLGFDARIADDDAAVVAGAGDTGAAAARAPKSRKGLNATGAAAGALIAPNGLAGAGVGVGAANALPPPNDARKGLTGAAAATGAAAGAANEANGLATAPPKAGDDAPNAEGDANAEATGACAAAARA